MNRSVIDEAQEFMAKFITMRDVILEQLKELGVSTERINELMEGHKEHPLHVMHEPSGAESQPQEEVEEGVPTEQLEPVEMESQPQEKMEVEEEVPAKEP